MDSTAKIWNSHFIQTSLKCIPYYCWMADADAAMTDCVWPLLEQNINYEDDCRMDETVD